MGKWILEDKQQFHVLNYCGNFFPSSWTAPHDALVGTAQQAMTSGTLPPCSQTYGSIWHEVRRQATLSDESLEQGRNRSRELNFSP